VTVNPFRAFADRFSERRWFATVGRFVVRPADSAFRRLGLARRFGRPLSAIATGIDNAYLTTTGRRSGRSRTVPVLPIDLDDGRVALVASNWGQDTRPAWYHNLVADPSCRLERGGVTSAHRARPAGDDERDAIWRRALAVYPAWRAYQERTPHDIDVLVLEPDD